MRYIMASAAVLMLLGLVYRSWMLGLCGGALLVGVAFSVWFCQNAEEE